MGQRLLTTWQTLHPDERLERLAMLAKAGAVGPVLPVAFAAACVSAGVTRREPVDANANTQPATPGPAATRLTPNGQTDPHTRRAPTPRRRAAAATRTHATPAAHPPRSGTS